MLDSKRRMPYPPRLFCLLMLVGCTGFLACGFPVPESVEYRGGDSRLDRMEDVSLPDAGHTDAGHTDAWRVFDADTSNPDCQSQIELCNEVDDDCDGLVDEDFDDLGAPCVVNSGLCETMGRLVCAGEESSDGTLSCETERPVSERLEEVCDGLDNDAGMTDESLE